MTATRSGSPWIVLYVEAEMSDESSPRTMGGDWIASARSAKDALRQSVKLCNEPAGTVAYAVRVEDCTSFVAALDWKANRS